MYYFIIPIKIPFLLLSTYMLFSLSSSDNSQDVQDCTQSLVGLATCLPYVGETAKSPTPDCCNGLKEVLRTNRKCLCVIIKDRNDPNLSLDINVTLALTLPQVCNAPANISECPALLNLPPNSQEAQIFYQINSTSSANTPLAGGPIANVVPGPIGAGANGSNGQQRNISSGKGKKWITLGGTMLIWVFSTKLRV